jgi:hypothetical protein
MIRSSARAAGDPLVHGVRQQRAFGDPARPSIDRLPLQLQPLRHHAGAGLAEPAGCLSGAIVDRMRGVVIEHRDALIVLNGTMARSRCTTSIRPTSTTPARCSRAASPPTGTNSMGGGIPAAGDAARLGHGHGGAVRLRPSAIRRRPRLAPHRIRGTMPTARASAPRCSGSILHAALARLRGLEGDDRLPAFSEVAEHLGQLAAAGAIEEPFARESLSRWRKQASA